MSNILKVKDFNYRDLKEYANRRACDGNWDAITFLIVADFMESIPKGMHKKKDKYVKEHIDEVFNLKDYPNMSINIDTGEVFMDGR